ncbi:MAG: flagellin [SAR324 cluster bacterium]|nr:flagellin [SAR324 cluster bacterium]
MAIRINHNISSLNTQRQLGNTTNIQAKNLERLSSGLKINRGADGPAVLVSSERMRSQISGLKQAVDNSEVAISQVQTAEASLEEVSRLLINARQLAVHAANEGANDALMLQADQEEITNALDTVDRIAKYTQFGTKNLIDGSRGANGVANGENMEYVTAGVNTKTSPVSGYRVSIDQVATRSEMKGQVALTQAVIDAGERITISEGGKTLTFVTEAGQNVDSTLNALDVKIKEVGLNVDLLRDEAGIIHMRHKEYGSKFGITASSSTAGILSMEGNVSVQAIRGQDVAGKINGEEAVGDGQILTGKVGTANVEGLAVRYTGESIPQPAYEVGTVAVFQNSLSYQIGANAGQTTRLSLKDMSSRALGTGVKNESGFKTLREVNVQNEAKAQDTIRVLDSALAEVATTRATIGAFQKNNLESNLNSLRNAHENLTNSESVLRDADMASEMAEFTRNQIMMQSGTAMLAQANQTPQAVLSLLGQ